MSSSEDMGISFVATCNACEDIELADRGKLPEGWHYSKDKKYLLCPNCLRKWSKRWGKKLKE